jgi:Tfp pilus assembly protein PilF
MFFMQFYSLLGHRVSDSVTKDRHIRRRVLPVKRSVLCAALVLLPFICSCATVEQEGNVSQASAHYKMGVGHLSENKVQQAFVEFQRAYELDPRNKEVLNAIGIIYLLHFDETQKAADFFQKAVKVDPDYSEAYNNLGVAHEKLGKFDTAIPFYKKAVSNLLYSTPENSFINMGRAYYRLGKFDDAATAYKEAIKRAPNRDLPYLGLALCYNATGKYGDASIALSRAISLNTVYKGDAGRAAEDFNARRIISSGYEQKDLSDYLEILKY